MEGDILSQFNIRKKILTNMDVMLLKLAKKITQV